MRNNSLSTAREVEIVGYISLFIFSVIPTNFKDNFVSVFYRIKRPEFQFRAEQIEATFEHENLLIYYNSSSKIKKCPSGKLYDTYTSTKKWLKSDSHQKKKNKLQLGKTQQTQKTSKSSTKSITKMTKLLKNYGFEQ